MIRKYLCAECGGVFICECDRLIALQFLPHQTRFGVESGTQRRLPVSGFAKGMCSECRGLKEEAHPRAAIYGLKGKVERYYWREIFKTICQTAHDWMQQQGVQTKNINEFRSKFPQKYKELDKLARRYWQEYHKKRPKYSMKEETEAEFLSKVKVTSREIFAEYVQIGKGDRRLGWWINSAGQLCSAERIVIEYYKSLGYDVRTCERKLITIWVATFLAPVIQDFSDPLLRCGFRGSTRGYTMHNRNTPIICIWKPGDFGSQEYYRRRHKEIEYWLEKMEHTEDLPRLFEKLLDESTLLRDYLWVNEDTHVELGRTGLRVVPPEVILKCIKWAIQDFWNRQSGWPDLFVFRNAEYLFVEVKSPLDELSSEQMNWFRWATEESHIPSEICRLKKSSLPKTK